VSWTVVLGGLVVLACAALTVREVIVDDVNWGVVGPLLIASAAIQLIARRLRHPPPPWVAHRLPSKNPDDY
jgi:hypothetical protein